MNKNNQLIIFLLLFYACRGPHEAAIIEIPLTGAITNPTQEISGLDWVGDNLILLPENLGGYLFMIPKSEINSSLNSKNQTPIKPSKILFLTPDYSTSIPGFEGFESIAFYQNKFVVTLEAKAAGDMHGYIAWGTLDPKTEVARIHKQDILELPMPVQVKNMTYESLLFDGNDVIIFFEANGKNIRKTSWQYLVSMKDYSVSKIDFPQIEYRITDVTRLNNQKHFWGINYFWKGDRKRLKPARDFLFKKYGEGESHQKFDTVERLVSFQIYNGNIILSDKSPIQIQLSEKGSRNWEGIVRLDQKGFLIITDKYPGTILGFVPLQK